MNESKHYKMYKAGKLWLTATITVLAFTGMTTAVKADDQGTSTINTQQVIAASNGPAESTTASASTATASSATTESAAVADSAVADNTQVNVLENDSSSEERLLDNNLLSRAESFHIFVNEVQIGADVNGNIATRHYISGNEFGTRNESHNYKLNGQNGDVYYIESFDQLGANAFRNSNSYVVFGDQAWEKIEIKDHHVFASGTRLDRLNPDSETVDHAKLVDFDQEFAALQKLADFYSAQEQTNGVKVDFSDMNNRYIDVSGVAPDAKVIYISVPVNYLSDSQPLTIKGLSSSENGPVVIVNVDLGSQASEYSIGTQTKLVYDDNQTISSNEEHAKPNHVIWNFGNTQAKLNVGSGYFMGSVLAP